MISDMLIKDWLNKLPVKYRKEALNAHSKHNKSCYMKVSSMHRALEYAFDWKNTPVTTDDQWRGLTEMYRQEQNMKDLTNKTTLETESGILITIQSNKDNNKDNFNMVLNEVIRLDSVMGVKVLL